MKILTTINDIRKYRQLGKQVNADDFEARVREVQENELTELLGDAMAFDFFNYLDNLWSVQAGTFTRDSATQLTAVGVDLSAWNDYALKINDEVFVIVESAIFGGSDTVITVTGYDLPDALTSIEYKAENNYIKLLNGTTYTKDGNTILFNGLRPFISWKFLSIRIIDGNVKMSDVGTFSITSDNFMPASNKEKEAAKNVFLQNSVREENRIVNYLNENTSTFILWQSKGGAQNIENYNLFII